MFRNVLLTAALGCGSAFAGEMEAPAPAPMTAPAEDSLLSGSLSLDWNSHFVSYGADVWADGSSIKGGTFNPSLELNWALTENFTAILGTWWDVNGKVPSAIGGRLQEVDVWVGGAYAFGDFSVTALYQNWLYASGNEQIVDIILAYDCFLSPSLTIHNRVDPGASGGNNGTVLVAGIEQGFDLGPVSFAVPLNLAYFIDDDFHPGATDSGLGYGSIGLNATYPLEFISDRYGEWDLHGGVTYYVTDGGVIPGNVKGDFLTMNVGIGCSF